MAKRVSNPPHPRLTEEEMRRRFNEGLYWQRMQDGEFSEVVISETDNIAFPEMRDQYPDIRSRTARYQDGVGMDIVEVHYYIDRQGGSIIPNKRPDPKLLFEDGVMYHKERPANREKRLADEAATVSGRVDTESLS